MDIGDEFYYLFVWAEKKELLLKQYNTNHSTLKLHKLLNAS